MKVLSLARFYVGVLLAVGSAIMVCCTDINIFISITLLVLGAILIATSEYGPMR